MIDTIRGHRILLVLLMGTLVITPRALSQVTPAESSTPPDDTPSLKVSGEIYTDYTYVREPTTKDSDGNTIHAKGFDVRRAYVIVSGDISRLFSYRVTGDVTRETLTTQNLGEGETVTLSTSGSLEYRLKHAYGQLNLDQWTTRGTWIRLGIQQTPFIPFMEDIYRYRFQGTDISEREGLQSSADNGLSFHYNFPHNYGDLQLGYYNGDGYSKPESNDQQALMLRATLRPAPKAGALSGLRLSVFYDDDQYMRDDPRKRLFGMLSFEHKYVTTALEYITATDQASASAAQVDSSGYSIWVIPRTNFGLEGLLRYDKFKPNNDVDATKQRTIIGIAYWFPVQKGVAATVMLDYEGLSYDTELNRPDETRYALHTLFKF